MVGGARGARCGALDALLLLAWVVGCGSDGATPVIHGTVSRASFGVTPDGESVDVFTLANGSGVEVRAITYGGIIVSLRVPDRDGRLGDIVLGFDNLDGYVEGSPYFGAIVGRYANRIAKGQFTLAGETYHLATNNGPNHLHGGVRGFDKIVWHAEMLESDSGVAVIFTHTSPDGDEGYPGTLSIRVTYTLTPGNELVVDYLATTDHATPINLSQHTYFNLAGDGRRDVLEHVLTINAAHFTPVDATLIPTGVIASVAGTPFDFTTPTAIGARIDLEDEQLENGGGYDHNFVLDRDGAGLGYAATCTRRNRDSSSTPGTSWTVASSGNPDGSIVIAMVSVWRRSTSRIPPISPPSHRRLCAPARSIAHGRCLCFLIPPDFDT